MVCKNIGTCKYPVNLIEFTGVCVVTEVDHPGCPVEGFTHTKTPEGWRHYIRITYNELHGTEY